MIYLQSCTKEGSRRRAPGEHRSLKIEQQEKQERKGFPKETMGMRGVRWGNSAISSKIEKENSTHKKQVKAVYGLQSYRTLKWRVWSWLRMNAGGVHNTFKSNEAAMLSGGRVSNAWATYLWQWNNTGKLVLIPHKAAKPHGKAVKEQSVIDGLASD